MDYFSEQIVVKRKDSTDNVKKIIIYTASVILAITAGYFLFPIGVLLAVGVLFGGYYLLTGLDCEYEYIITNGELDIDKIIAKRQRKTLITVNISEFTSFGKVSSDANNSECTSVIALGEGKADDYYAIFNNSSIGKVYLAFSPNEKTLETINRYLTRNLK